MRKNSDRVAAALKYMPLNGEQLFIVPPNDVQSVHSNSIDLKDPFNEEDDLLDTSTAITTPSATSSRKQSNRSVN